MPVAAPIPLPAGRRYASLYALSSAWPSGELWNAGSASVVAELRWLARGAATASGRLIWRSIRFTRICSTVVMIEAPPGDPTVRNGLPFVVTIVGAIEERGRLPPSARLGAVVDAVSKSVSSLLRRNP